MSFAMSLAGFVLLLGIAAAFVCHRSRHWKPSLIALAVLATLSWLMYLQLGAARDLRVQSWLNELQQGEELSSDEREALRGLLAELGDEASGERYAFLLGHDFLAQEEYSQARETFGALRARGVDDAEVALAFVQSDFLAREGVLGDDSRTLARGLADSEHPLALEMLVLDALRSNDQQAFMQYWPSYASTPRGAELGRRLGWGEAPRTPGEATIEIQVSAAGDVRAPPDTPVFVLARRAQSPSPPLAVRRLRFADLPARVRLSDSDAMLETNRLSDASQVEVVARIAYSGGPIAAEGDLEVSSGALDLAAGGLEVELTIE